MYIYTHIQGANLAMHVMDRSVDLTRRLPEKQVVKAIKRNLLYDPVPHPEDATKVWIFIYICIYIYICMYIYMYMYVYMYIYDCIYAHMYMNISAHTYIRTHMRPHVHAHSQTHSNPYSIIYISAYSRSCIYTYIRM